MDQLHQSLERIAEAFEEQNRQNAEWIVMQTKWRHEDKKNDVGKQIITIHEECALLQKGWIEEQRKMLAVHLEKEYQVYLESLREELKKKLLGSENA